MSLFFCYLHETLCDIHICMCVCTICARRNIRDSIIVWVMTMWGFSRAHHATHIIMSIQSFIRHGMHSFVVVVVWKTRTSFDAVRHWVLKYGRLRLAVQIDKHTHTPKKKITACFLFILHRSKGIYNTIFTPVTCCVLKDTIDFSSFWWKWMCIFECGS